MMQREQPLKTLFVAEHEGDYELLCSALRTAGFGADCRRVGCEADFLDALERDLPELVLAKSAPAGFDARRALYMLRERGLDLPFIVIADNPIESKLLEWNRLGADDIVITDRLWRLGRAVDGALATRQLRKENRAALEQLRSSEERFRRLTENLPDTIYRLRFTPDLGYDYLSPSIEDVTGYPPQMFYEDWRLLYSVIHPDDVALLMAKIEADKTPKEPFTLRWVHRNGSMVWTEQHNVPVYDKQGRLLAVEGVSRDITERILRQREQEAVLALVNGLRDSMRRAEILPVLLRTAIDWFDADCAAVTAARPGSDVALVELGLGAWQGWQDLPLALGRGTAALALEHNQPFSTQDAQQDLHGLPAAWVDGLSGLACYPLVAQGQTLGLLWIGTRPLTAKQFAANLRALAAVAGIGASALHRASLYETLQHSANFDVEQSYDASITAWCRALETRGAETLAHIEKVAGWTLELARAMGVPAEELPNVRRGALLHDIGKLGLPDSILLKTGALTGEEFEQMHRHPQYAYDWLAHIPYLKAAVEIPYAHHESWDGNGYPRRLAGTQIPLAARIFAVIDSYEALISHRPYRPAWPKEEALEYIQSMAGARFDPEVVQVFLLLAPGWE